MAHFKHEVTWLLWGTRHPPTPSTRAATCFGNRVFTGDQIEMRSLGWLSPNVSVLVERGTLAQRDMHRGRGTRHREGTPSMVGNAWVPEARRWLE